MTPQFENIESFLAMGGHGFYVWACYGLVAFAVIFGVGYVKSERKRAIKQLNTNYARKNQQVNQSKKQQRDGYE